MRLIACGTRPALCRHRVYGVRDHACESLRGNERSVCRHMPLEVGPQRIFAGPRRSSCGKWPYFRLIHPAASFGHVDGLVGVALG